MFKKDSVPSTLLVATILCVVCSVMVSTAAVGLRERQEAQKARDRMVNILRAAGLYDSDAPDAGKVDVKRIFNERVEPKVIEFATGAFVEAVDPVSYDQRAAASDPARSVEIPDATDVGGIGRRAQYGLVYLVKGPSGELEQVVLPIYGKGLWSTMYGFLALEADLNTVKGITFYEHGETPGLGGEVDNPRWKAQWPGKEVFGDDGGLEIEVLKGIVNPRSPDAVHQVDGLAGATITTRGVTNLLHYWLGEHGYEPFLDRMRKSAR